MDIDNVPVAYMLIGAPGSGKSTWREKYLKNDTKNTVVISTDDLVDEYARENGLTYTQAFSAVNMDDITKRAKERFNEAVSQKRNIIIDRTNMSAKSRQYWINRLNEYYRVAVVFEVPRSELQKRLKLREADTGKAIPEYVVNNMLISFQAPSISTWPRSNSEFHQVIEI